MKLLPAAFPILTDLWEGLDEFFTPGVEVLTAGTTEQAMAAVELGESQLRRISTAARERTLAQHTAECRVKDLELALESADRAVA